MMRERRFEWGGLGVDRGDFITAAEALDILRPLVAAPDGVDVETGLRDGEAFVRVSRGGRRAVVSTPGIRWFSLEVDSGHRVRIDDATSTRAEAAALLGSFVEAAVAYVTGDMHPERARWGSTVTVPTGERWIVLRSTWRSRTGGGGRA